MKQLNPLALHYESLYRMKDFQAHASRDKLVLETKRSYSETFEQGHAQKGWRHLHQKLVGIGKLILFRA